MRVFATTHIVLAVLAVLVSARPDSDVDSSEDTARNEASACPVEEAADKLREKILSCVSLGEILENLDNQNTTEDIQEVLNGYCNKLSSAQECIVKTREEAVQCLSSGEEYENVKVVSKFLQVILNVLCENEGTRLVATVKKLATLPNGWEELAKPCFEKLFTETPSSHATSSRLSLRMYDNLNEFKSCVVVLGQENYVDLDTILDLVNEITESMTCEEPDSDVEVLCSSIPER